MAPLKLLITGPTGYIGGAVLTTILKSNKDSLQNLEISVLVRGEQRARSLSESGVRPILFENLDQSDVLQQAASEHDIVINTASGFHSSSAKALIIGLGKRKKQTGKAVYFIHTSGTSNLGDRPITGQYSEQHVFSDKENIHAYEKFRQSIEEYDQRTADLVVVETGREVGVRTYIIMSPLIYGFGNVPFKNQSLQIPWMMRVALQKRQAMVIGNGKGVWNYVHIADLTTLYELILAKLIAGESIPEGEKGIYFSQTGEFTWLDLAKSIAEVGYELGVLDSAEVKSVSLDEGAAALAGGNSQLTELGFASYSRTKAELGKELGWAPVRTAKDWETNFIEEMKVILKSAL
ncbi:hypothetical protein B0H34DRAFT_493076 [Crassisporium funariophilum]|nr:hypothetical protein B0H34DRAFT_493076 [Crassisporium funariophilum]